MPEINFRVKIIGGKRTDSRVYVESMADKNKKIVFRHGTVLSSGEINVAIRDFIVKFIYQ